MNEFLKAQGPTIISGIILTMITGVGTLVWQLLKTKLSKSRSSTPPQLPVPQYPPSQAGMHIPSEYPQQIAWAKPPVQDSWQAPWALGLGLGSYLLWFVAPILVFPAILLSL